MARHDVVLARGGAQHFGHPLQHMVAFGVAVAVVYLLEMIEVDHQQGGAFLAAMRGAQHLRGQLVKGAPVEQAGEAVAVGQLLQGPMQLLQLLGLLPEIVFRGLAFGDVAHHAEGQGLALEEHRTQHDVDRQLAAILAQGGQFDSSPIGRLCASLLNLCGGRHGGRRSGAEPAFQRAGRSARCDRNRTGSRPGVTRVMDPAGSTPAGRPACIQRCVVKAIDAEAAERSSSGGLRDSFMVARVWRIIVGRGLAVHERDVVLDEAAIARVGASAR